MTGINVLPDIPKGGNKLENIAVSKGKEASDGNQNAASIFTALLNGRMNSYSNSKGRSSLADQDAEEKQSNAYSVQDDQNSKGLENILGYGNFVLPFLNQMLESNLPAGKEANSGEVMGQGLGFGDTSCGSSKNLEATMLNLISLASDDSLGSTGMMTLSSQGDNLGNTELDKYREVIANLLVELSGVITDSTPESNLVRVDNKGTNTFSQELAKIIQGWLTTDTVLNNSVKTKDLPQELAKILQSWLTVSDDDMDSDISTGGQSRFQKLIEGLIAGSGNVGNSDLNTKVANLLAALYPILKEGAEGAKGPQNVNEVLRNQLKEIGIDSETIANIQKETASQVKIQQRPEETGLRESKLLQNFQDVLKEEVSKVKTDPLKSEDFLGAKANQTQPLSSGVGSVAATNIGHLAGVEGRISAIPLWEQISTVVREQVMSKQQALKELDIQLHPAELGSIRIFLRWESGQVHLQVQASEPATGQLLQNQLPDLRQNLLSQGVNCGSLQMGQGGEGRQPFQGDEAQRTLRQSNLPADEDEDQVSIAIPDSLGRDGISRLNVTA